MEHGDLTGQSEGTMWNFRALYRRTLLSLSYAAQLGQIAKTRRKLNWKTSETECFYLCLQRFDIF